MNLVAKLNQTDLVPLSMLSPEQTFVLHLLSLPIKADNSTVYLGLQLKTTLIYYRSSRVFGS